MLRLLLPLAFTPLAFAAIVQFIPNTSFFNPSNFQDGKLPCSKKTIVFPDNIEQTVIIDSDLEASEIILPENGDFILESAALTVGANNSDDNCTSGNTYYKESAMSTWAQPNIWHSSRFTKATPDAERIPCFDDTVLIPEDSKFTLELPKQMQYVQQFKIGNQSLDNVLLSTYISSNEGNAIAISDYEEISVEVDNTPCTKKIGCPCQIYPLHIECWKKVCPVPTCLSPIQPIGHCCKICGGALIFEAGETFDYVQFNEFVNNVLSSYTGIVYHLGRPLGRMVQLVVVEENKYTEESSEAVNRINNLMASSWSLRSTQTQLSGTPMSKYGLGGKIFVSVFFIVIFVFSAMYVYYYKIPDIRMPLMGRSWFGQLGIFSRFERRSDSVVSLTRRDSGVTLRPGAAAGFRNPLYDSKRGRVIVTESTEE